MSTVTPQKIKELRERTGIGMGKCKEALTEANGDIETAIANLRKAGMASAVKKECRETNEGMIATAENDQFLALVEVNAETDFVVKNERFQVFAKELAQMVCEKQPDSLEAFMAFPSSSDPQLTVDQHRSTIVQSLGENIQVKRFEVFPKKANTSMFAYSHSGGKLVTFVEITGSADETALAKEIAMHIAAEAPEYISSDEVPERVIEHEKEIARAQMKGKPENMIEKILEGKLKAYFEQACLLYQKFIKDNSVTIEQLVSNRSKECGKTLKVTQFLRWNIGQ
jgi:elongation factor Ts